MSIHDILRLRYVGLEVGTRACSQGRLVSSWHSGSRRGERGLDHRLNPRLEKSVCFEYFSGDEALDGCSLTAETRHMRVDKRRINGVHSRLDSAVFAHVMPSDEKNSGKSSTVHNSGPSSERASLCMPAATIELHAELFLLN
jgi:hypothetical protein